MTAGAPLTRRQFQAATGVSDVVLGRLEVYAEMLGKWQRRMNLVGPGTLADPWRRHMLDSAQLAPLIPAAGVVADLGSGAGFPGLVLAIMGVGGIRLLESAQRKCAFLAEVNRATGGGAEIIRGRIESLAPQEADVIVARALAPLPRLLVLAHRHLARGGCCLFLKGQNIEEELTETTKSWIMGVERIQSVTDPSAVILKLEGPNPRHG